MKTFEILILCRIYFAWGSLLIFIKYSNKKQTFHTLNLDYLKYERSTPLSCKDLRIKKLDFEESYQFLIYLTIPSPFYKALPAEGSHVCSAKMSFLLAVKSLTNSAVMKYYSDLKVKNIKYFIWFALSAHCGFHSANCKYVFPFCNTAAFLD